MTIQDKLKIKAHLSVLKQLNYMDERCDGLRVELKMGSVIDRELKITKETFTGSFIGTMPNTVDGKEFKIEVRTLERISDEDAIEVAKFCHASSHKDNHVLLHEGKDLIKNYLYRQSNVWGRNWLQVFDYLREKGYALPYKGWSVEQLVEFGIYKLID